MLTKLDMKNYVYGVRVIQDNLTSNYVRYTKSYIPKPFKWKLKKWEWHTAPDWKDNKDCGNGLHFWLNGEGSYGATQITPHHIWLLVRAKKNECVELNKKAKAKSLQIIDWGVKDYIAAQMKVLKPNAAVNFSNISYQNKNQSLIVGHWSNVNLQSDTEATVKTGDNCIVTVGNYSKVTTGENCLIYAGYKSTVECEENCKVFVGNYAKVRAGSGSVICFNKRSTIIKITWSNYCNQLLELNNDNRITVVK